MQPATAKRFTASEVLFVQWCDLRQPRGAGTGLRLACGRSVVGAAALALALGALPGAGRADGWHNAALATASLDQWLSDLKREVPDIVNLLSGTQLRAGKGAEGLKELQERLGNGKDAGGGPRGPGGRLDAKLTPQQQALLARKVNDCMEVLAYMDPRNIIPTEFPTFQLGKIPEYRRAAKEMLRLMGSAGTSAIVTQVRSALMNPPQQGGEVQTTAAYYYDLLELLGTAAAEGRLTVEDMQSLQEAAGGMKVGPQAAFAKAVVDVLAKHLDIVALTQMAAQMRDYGRKKALHEQIRQRITKSEVPELLRAARHADVTEQVKTQIADELERRLEKSSLLDLLGMVAMDLPDTVKQAAAAELASRSPSYAELKEQIPAIWEFASSSDAQAAQAARRHVAVAFQRAPIAECLDWLGKNNPPLHAVIWEQVDARIQRADEARRGSYLTAGLAVFQDTNASLACRTAALELLRRVKRKDAAAPVIAMLSTMPRELWPKAGEMLRGVTGQDFGPRAGDGLAEVTVAIKNWRAWLAQQGGGG